MGQMIVLLVSRHQAPKNSALAPSKSASTSIGCVNVMSLNALFGGSAPCLSSPHNYASLAPSPINGLPAAAAPRRPNRVTRKASGAQERELEWLFVVEVGASSWFPLPRTFLSFSRSTKLKLRTWTTLINTPLRTNTLD